MLFPRCACTFMALFPQHWRKYCDVEGGATDAGQPRGTTPKVFWLFACFSKTFLGQISKGKGYRLILLKGMVPYVLSPIKQTVQFNEWPPPPKVHLWLPFPGPPLSKTCNEHCKRPSLFSVFIQFVLDFLEAAVPYRLLGRACALWLLELTCSRRENGLSCRHGVKPLTHSLFSV